MPSMTTCEWRETRRAMVAQADEVGRLTGWRRDNGMGLLGLARTRDADVLTESNFVTAYNMLREELGDVVDIVRFGHFAFGWVEEIAVPLTRRGCEIATEIAAALEDYPVLDDTDYSDREYTDLLETLTACYDIPTDDAGDVASYLFDTNSVSRGDDIRHGDEVAAIGRYLSDPRGWEREREAGDVSEEEEGHVAEYRTWWEYNVR